MNAPPASDAVRAAPIEMAALARAVRPDWDQARIDGALQGARDARMPWPLVLVNFPRLMADAMADPRDLLKPLDSPLVKKAGAPPGGEYRRLRQERAELERTRLADPAADDLTDRRESAR